MPEAVPSESVPKSRGAESATASPHTTGGLCRDPLFWMIALLIVFLLQGTGIVSDDFFYIFEQQQRGGGIVEALIPRGIFITLPVEQVTHVLFFRLSTLEWIAPIEFAKTLHTLLTFGMISAFFALHMPGRRAQIAAFLFLFHPAHDATAFWFLSQYFAIMIGLFLFAYVQLERGRPRTGMVLATLGSFISYGSPPVAFAVALLFVLRGKVRAALAVWIPNLVFCIYYVVVSRLLRVSISRLPDSLSLGAFVRQAIIQVLSFADAVLGPSFLLKTFWSVAAMGAAATLAGAVFAAGWFMLERRERDHGSAATRLDWRVLVALSVLAVGALAMFAVTGRYPQIAFNLGNRVTTFGCLLLVYVFMAAPMPRTLRLAGIAVMLAAALGLSTHWRDWHARQTAVIERMRRNPELLALDGSVPVLVSGNQYSRLGPFAHIEFLSEHWVVDGILKQLGDGRLTGLALNRRFEVSGNRLLDHKYGESHVLVEPVPVYDSEADRILLLDRAALQATIERLPEDRRHWLQFIENARINAWIVALMPRLRYAF